MLMEPEISSKIEELKKLSSDSSRMDLEIGAKIEYLYPHLRSYSKIGKEIKRSKTWVKERHQYYCWVPRLQKLLENPKFLPCCSFVRFINGKKLQTLVEKGREQGFKFDEATSRVRNMILILSFFCSGLEGFTIRLQCKLLQKLHYENTSKPKY
jgi:hypothetical protein